MAALTTRRWTDDGYPADTPGLDICWQNFASCAELMLRQAARLQPVPWRETLHELCRCTSGRESSWWLAGSTALAVRGARIEPGDIDLVCSGDGALSLGVIFADAIIEPVVHDACSPISDYWGCASWAPGLNGSVLPRPASTPLRRPTSGPPPRPGSRP